MSNGTPVPATAMATYAGQQTLSQLWLNGENYFPDGQSAEDSFFWLVVVDLTDLSVVANDVSSDGQTVPADVSKFAGNPQYFLYAITNAAWASLQPQGDLYSLLQQAGSGTKLARLEQIYNTIGTGFLGNFSYILAATMTEGDDSGFEMLSMDHETILTMGFLPITVDGNTIYAPIQSGTA